MTSVPESHTIEESSPDTLFTRNLEAFFRRAGNAEKMVLATSADNRVTARTMSCIIHEKTIYFQTDRNFLKYRQIISNPRVALCSGNTQIEGIAREIGHPLDPENAFFASLYRHYYERSFALYSPLPNEVLINVEPEKITLWAYDEGKPYRDFFDIPERSYSREYYNA